MSVNSAILLVVIVACACHKINLSTNPRVPTAV
jgi:hypothetical protein